MSLDLYVRTCVRVYVYGVCVVFVYECVQVYDFHNNFHLFYMPRLNMSMSHDNFS